MHRRKGKVCNCANRTRLLQGFERNVAAEGSVLGFLVCSQALFQAQSKKENSLFRDHMLLGVARQ